MHSPIKLQAITSDSDIIHQSYPCGIYECNKSTELIKTYPRSEHEFESFSDASRFVFDIDIKGFFPGLLVGFILGLFWFRK
jgi:hypothetical protein